MIDNFVLKNYKMINKLNIIKNFPQHYSEIISIKQLLIQHFIDAIVPIKKVTINHLIFQINSQN